MKEKILLIIEKYPKHFSQILQSKKYLAEKYWILENSRIKSNIFAEHIRSALYNETNICEYGNIKKLKSLNEGWRFCGHSSVCKCSEKNQKEKISEYFQTENNNKRLEKIKHTNLKKYGSISPFGNETIRKKAKNKILEKYGEENYFATKEFKKTIKNFNIENYGVSSFQKIHIPKENLIILDDKEKFVEFSKNKSIGEIANTLNVDNATIYNRLKKYQCEKIISNRSSFESELKNFLLKNDIKYVSNTRKIIPPYELDFYMPDQNLAIECNGDYWHSDIFKEKNYHYEKWIRCDQLGIKLVQIRENDWKLYNKLFKSMIINYANKNTVDIEKINIKQINHNEAEKFLNTNHLQGFCLGSVYLGGFDKNNNLLCVTVLEWISENNQLEIKRWGTIENSQCPILFTKIFNYIKSFFNFKDIISVTRNDWFSGNEFSISGFNKNRIIEPTCEYLIDGKWRNNDYLINENKDFSKILRYWDSGKIEWIWKT